MNAYSKDLRLKVLAAIDRGIPRREVADLFGISLSTIKRWLKRRRETGDVRIYEIPGRPSVKGAALREWLPKQLVRKAGARTREALLEAIAWALSTITPTDVAGWFDHCGYEVEVRYL